MSIQQHLHCYNLATKNGGPQVHFTVTTGTAPGVGAREAQRLLSVGGAWQCDRWLGDGTLFHHHWCLRLDLYRGIEACGALRYV